MSTRLNKVEDAAGPMKCVVIVNNLGIGGAERVVVDEVNEMYARGIDVMLVTLTLEPTNSYSDFCKLQSAQRIYIPFGSLADIRAYWKLTRVLRRARPNAVITHLWYANTIGRIAARFAGSKRVLSFEHNVYDEIKTSKQFFIDRLLQYWCTRIIAVSEPVRQSLIRHDICLERIVVIENGINLNRYIHANPSRIREDLSLAEAPLFIFVGRLIRQKGVDVLINAFANVKDAYLLIAGNGKDRDDLETLSGQLDLKGRVFFLGVRHDIPELMKAADCLVLPSRWEGQGLVIPEALAVGLPVIATDFAAAPSLVDNERTGIIVPREDSIALAAAMNKMRSKEFREVLATAAKRSAAKFAIARHIDTLLSYVE